MSRPKASAGFTLIEMMIVVTLLAMFATLALPGFQTMINNNRLQTASNEIGELLEYARMEAATRSQPVTVNVGNTTWSAPRNDKERAAFYASGRKPYSIKIGDNWVSYSKLGPLAYPMAIASAVAWYTKENPQAATDANEKKLLNVLSGVGQFFADQSYVQGMGDLLETLSGDPVALKRMASNIPSQLIPLVSLQRWVAQIIDPVYRESGKDFSVKSVIQNIKKGIPGLSKTVPAELDPSGKPSKVQNPLIKAFSPLDIGTEVPRYEKQLQLIRRQQRLNAIKKDAKGKRTIKTNF